MSTIQISELKPGKVVAANVTTADGRVLLAKGGKVEPWHLNLFQGLGIKSLEVEDSQEDRCIQEAADYVVDFFAYVNPDHPVMGELYNFAVDLVALRLGQGWTVPSLAERRAKNVENLSDVFSPDIVSPEKIAKHDVELSSFPEVYFKLREAIDSPATSVGRLAELVSQDMSLVAKLLKLANSPLYGLDQPIESIQRAIAIIGVKELSILALGMSAINYFKGIPPELIDMKTFWRHSISCGIFAKILAKTLGESHAERFFIAGLLHDAGRLILFKEMPYASSEAMIFARENVLPLVEAEQATFGFTHTMVSEHLLREWKFPPALSDLINHHHSPMAAPNPRDAAIIHVADVMANALGIAAGQMYVIPPFDEQAWDLLGIPAQGVQRICSDYEIQEENTLEVFS
jgi:HD-like signal output (HDOD) protein